MHVTSIPVEYACTLPTAAAAPNPFPKQNPSRTKERTFFTTKSCSSTIKIPKWLLPRNEKTEEKKQEMDGGMHIAVETPSQVADKTLANYYRQLTGSSTNLDEALCTPRGHEF